MYFCCFLLVVLFTVTGFAAQTTPPQGIIDKTPQHTAYTNVRIIVSPERTIESGTLVVKEGVITAVGADVKVPAGAVAVDLTGMTLAPGFIDPFTEYGLDVKKSPKRSRNAPPVYEAERVGCNAWNGAIHAEINWVEQFQPDHDDAESFLKLGFTSVQSANSDGVFRGRGFVTSLGDGLPNDLVIEPHGAHFIGFDKGSSIQQYPQSLMGAIALIRQTLIDADWYGQAHAAFERDPSQPRPEINLGLAALETVQNEPFVFEADNNLNLLRTDRIGREFGLEVIPVGGRYGFEHLEAIKATGRTIIVPLDFPDAPEVGTMEEELDVTLRKLRRWDWAPSNLAKLEEAGIRFALTTDGLQKKGDFATNLRRAIKRGLSEKTALAALTTIPAELCRVDDLVGTLEVGRLADFGVYSGDIFAEKTELLAMVTQGDKHEFQTLRQIDFGGYYEGTIGEKAVGLKLTDEGFGTGRKITGKFTQGESGVELSSPVVESGKLTFAADLEPFGSPGVARFSLRRDQSGLTGRVAYADGNLTTWSAATAEEPSAIANIGADSTETEAEEAETEADDSGGPISRLTYPNMAYGFESLPQPENVLLKNGTVWTSEDEGILENADLLIIDGYIEAVGRDLEAPSGCRLIDCSGKHVAAGIIDEHSHISLSGDVNEGTDAITSETRIGDIIRDDDISVYRSLAGGVTATRTAHGSANPIGGQQQVIKLRWGHTPDAMKADEAPPAIKFALGENVKQSNWGDNMTTRYPQTRMGVETIIKDIFQTALEYEAEWKAYESLGKNARARTIPPRKNLRLDAILEILNHERWIDCHAYRQAEILMLMRLAEEFGVTVKTFIHILEGYKVADEMAKHGAMGGSIPDWWAYKYEVYDAIAHGPKIMADHGVVVSITSDSRHLQRLLNQAAAKSVQYADMSQEEAWKMVTINAAKQLLAEDKLGSLKAGKDADFVIWSDNPLSIYAQVEQTWIDGAKYFDIEDDARMRAELIEEKNRLIQKLLEKPPKKKAGRKKKDASYEYKPGETGEGVEL